MYEIEPGKLWIGHAFDIRDPKRIWHTAIEVVIDLAQEEKPAQIPGSTVYCRYPLVDGGGNDSNIIKQAIQTTVYFLKVNKPTIVACSAGMSRSPALAAIALGIHKKQDPHNIIEQIASEKPLELNAQLWRELHDTNTH